VRQAPAAERPFFVDASGEDLFGIVTEPQPMPRGAAVIILSGGAFVGATNRNRVSVRLAREVAALGYHGVRMDYHGVGDSTGELYEYRLDKPFVGDLLAVVDHLEAEGVREFVLLGSTCFGSRTALAAAERLPNLRAVLLFALPLFDSLDLPGIESTSTTTFARRAMSPRVWRDLLDTKRRQRYLRILRTKGAGVLRRLGRGAARRGGGSPTVDLVSRQVVDPLEALAERRVPVLLGYGDDEPFYRDFCAARAWERLSRILDAPDSPVDVRTVPGAVHGLLTLETQANVIALAVEWLAALDARLAPAT
jgi:pimeloyl-ACP methyl ester carboxylesterase